MAGRYIKRQCQVASVESLQWKRLNSKFGIQSLSLGFVPLVYFLLKFNSIVRLWQKFQFEFDIEWVFSLPIFEQYFILFLPIFDFECYKKGRGIYSF